MAFVASSSVIVSTGNGKTMACRWLRSECYAHNLAWQEITYDTFTRAKRSGMMSELFELDRAGVIQFDDFDWMIRDRRKNDSPDMADFLTHLDGMEIKDGVVFLFTSNMSWNDLDAAAPTGAFGSYRNIYSARRTTSRTNAARALAARSPIAFVD